MRRIGLAAALAALALAALWLRVAPDAQQNTRPASDKILRAESVVEAANVVAAAELPAAETFLRIRASADGATLAPEMNLPRADPQNRWKNPAKPVEPVFPKNFADPVRVRCGVADVFAKPVGARSGSVAEITADGLIYRDAFDGCDVEYRCTDYKTEEFIIVRQAGGRFAERRIGFSSDSLWVGGRGTERHAETERRGDAEKKRCAAAVAVQSAIRPLGRKKGQSAMEFSWDLDLGSGENALTARLTPAHTIELVDSQNVPRLRINAPDGKDAAGKLLRAGEELRYTLSDNRLTLAANLEDCEFPVTIDPTWSSTGTMATARYLHSSVLLNNGLVLVAGGYSNGNFEQTSCELLDPNTGAFSSTASLVTARVGRAATLLGNGKVLVSGGIQGGTSTYLVSCELYDPAAGTWQPTGDLGAPRAFHAALLLANGKVLAAGGGSDTGSNFAIASTELYDASSGLWTGTGALIQKRRAPDAVVLASGDVLIAGGLTVGSGTQILQSCEVYSTAGGTWAATGSTAFKHSGGRLNLLSSGEVLAAGGLADNVGTTGVCERFQPGTGLWQTTGSLAVIRSDLTLTPLSATLFLGAGGVGGSPGGPNTFFSSCELYDAATQTWSPTNNMNLRRAFHTATKLADGSVVVIGGASANAISTATCERYSIKTNALAGTATVHSGLSVPVQLKSDSLFPPVTFALVGSPSQGTVSGTPPNCTYTAPANFSGTATFSFSTTDSTGTATGVVTVTVTNAAPKVTASASPPFTSEGVAVAFSSVASDPDGDAVSYRWDFGDGTTSTEANPVHAFATGGVYSVSVTVTDSVGASTTAVVSMKVFFKTDRPIARFTTSDVVGFVDLPLAFDATFSTDKQNAIVGYSWDFGDGSPRGAGQQISRAYAAAGTYTVTLTATDADGLTATATRPVVVLPADQIGLFNAFIKYKVKWDRNRQNTDTLNLDANVNVGDVVVQDGTAMALEIAGQRFEGTLNGRLQSKSANASWQVTANTRKQSAGEVFVRVKLKKANLGLGFNLAGAVAAGDDGDPVTVEIPVRLEIAGRSFEVAIESDFKFAKDGTKATGEGEGP